MLEPPPFLKDPFYEYKEPPKIYPDYEWEDSYPGTLKPGTKKTAHELDDVMAEWEGKENENVMAFPQDELIHIPLKPPEDILAFLARRGILDTADDAAERAPEVAGDALLDDEFDLEGEESEGFIAEGQLLDTKDQGATMSDFMT